MSISKWEVLVVCVILLNRNDRTRIIQFWWSEADTFPLAWDGIVLFIWFACFVCFFTGVFVRACVGGVVRDAGHLVICLLGSPVARGAVSPWERRQRRDGEGGANLFISKNHVHTLTPSIKVSPFQPETHKYTYFMRKICSHLKYDRGGSVGEF